MGFPQTDAKDLLVKCHRRCCICHKFCGVKMELDHIDPRADSHDDTIENAIPVCFECHAEIHLYNPKHPLGRRFTPGELRLHKEQWLRTCEAFPGSIAHAGTVSEAGTMERLFHEVEFNLEVAAHSHPNEVGCPFEVAQFDHALADGTYALFDNGLRMKLRSAYILAKRANNIFLPAMRTEHSGDSARGAHVAFEEARPYFEAVKACIISKLQV